MEKRVPWSRSLALAAILIAVAVALTALQSHYRGAGKRSPPEVLVGWLFTPVASAARGVSGTMQTLGTGLFSAGALRRENAEMHAQLVQLAGYTESTERLRREVDDLRALADLPLLPGRRKVIADVRGFSPLDNSITIGAGAAQGLRQGQPVVSADGLLAIVRAVGPQESQAALITSASTTIGALASNHKPPPAGLIRGENATTLTLTFADPNAPVAIGDTIRTTGFSDRIPPGLLIGRVLQVELVPELGARTAKVFPAARIDGVGEVAILL